MSRYEGLIVYALFYRLSPLRVVFAYGWVFIETTTPVPNICVCAMRYDLPPVKSPFQTIQPFRVWHLSVPRYHQAYKSLFVYVSFVSFWQYLPLSFWEFLTRTCEAHVLHVYTTYKVDWVIRLFARLLSHFLRVFPTRQLPSANTKLSLNFGVCTRTHGTGQLLNWTTELNCRRRYAIWTIWYICYIVHAIWGLMERGACSSKIARWLPRPFTDIYDLRT